MVVKKEGHHLKRFTIFGYHPVYEAIKSGAPVEEIIINKAIYNKERAQSILKSADNLGIKVKILTGDIFTSLPKSNQGFAAALSPYKYYNIRKVVGDLIEKDLISKSVILILSGINDPQNLGAVIRSAAFFDVNAVVIPLHRAASITASVYKASAGTVSMVKVCREVNIVQTLNFLKKEGYWIYAADVGADRKLEKIEFIFPVALVMGAEDKGSGKLILDSCDELFSIKGRSDIDSLNVSVAAGISLSRIFYVWSCDE